jgi:hypothetical protein
LVREREKLRARADTQVSHTAKGAA